MADNRAGERRQVFGRDGFDRLRAHADAQQSPGVGGAKRCAGRRGATAYGLGHGRLAADGKRRRGAGGRRSVGRYGMLLFRMPDPELTYVEMVHPADFQHDELSWGGVAGHLRMHIGCFGPIGKGRDPSCPGAGHFSGPAGRHGGRGAVLRRVCRGRSAVGHVNSADIAVAVQGRRNGGPKRVKHDRRLHYRELSAAKRPRGGTVSPLRAGPADHRLPLPSAAGRGGRGSTLRELDADLAGGRSLQVAGDAGGRRARAVLHGRRLGSGEVPEVGRDGAPNAAQPAVPLDAPGTEAAVGHQRPAAGPRHGRGHLARVQRETAHARVLRPRHHAADGRGAGLHDGRSGRHAGASPGHRGRRVVPDPGAAHVSSRSGDGRRIAQGVQRLGGPAGRAERHRHRRRFRPLLGRLAAAARLLPLGRLPAFRSRARHVLCGRLYAGRSGGRVAARAQRQTAGRRTRSSSSSRPCSTNWPR